MSDYVAFFVHPDAKTTSVVHEYHYIYKYLCTGPTYEKYMENLLSLSKICVEKGIQRVFLVEKSFYASKIFDDITDKDIVIETNKGDAREWFCSPQFEADLLKRLKGQGKKILVAGAFGPFYSRLIDLVKMGCVAGVSGKLAEAGLGVSVVLDCVLVEDGTHLKVKKSKFIIDGKTTVFERQTKPIHREFDLGQKFISTALSKVRKIT